MRHWMNQEEKPVTLIFSSAPIARAFRDSIKGTVRGKMSVRKTKGWNTHSLVIQPHAYSDVIEIRRNYRPEESRYMTIAENL